jgi:hypothetical protein
MQTIIPNVSGVSELQRYSKRILNTVKTKRQPVFLADRNKISSVILDVETYEQLVQIAQSSESNFWTQAQESSLSFWNHSSNDAYEQLLAS